jgi:hypothetical protein
VKKGYTSFVARADRSTWKTRVVPEPFSAEEEAADALFWDAIPVRERARATWELSKELYLLTARNAGEPLTEADLERRLPRAAYRIERR